MGNNSLIDRLRNLEKRIDARIADVDVGYSLAAAGFDRVSHLRRLADRNRKVNEKEFVRLYLLRMNGREISRELGIHPGYVSALARRLGVYKPGGTIKPKSAISSRQAVAYYENGRSTYQIAKIMGCSQGYVWNVLKRSGIKLRRAGRCSSTYCTYEGCNSLAKKWKTKDGTLRGSLCAFHIGVKYNRAQRTRSRLRNNIPPERWRIRDDERFDGEAIR